ncbi:unnamed protein product [Bursaphelenchus okinawaensis]|uniref:Uncharacterized protein n=1 Tax=Bursaphelenchus okinawaensis TaxID=465554 RepID=A0A811LAD8_9BILA|nr:unnamed protein product [Bursaphelenchus okinawaensis]CAG9122006.1 unnamed protein product [Bursaphelenchus okinawaensis]
MTPATDCAGLLADIMGSLCLSSTEQKAVPSADAVPSTAAPSGQLNDVALSDLLATAMRKRNEVLEGREIDFRRTIQHFNMIQRLCKQLEDSRAKKCQRNIKKATRGRGGRYKKVYPTSLKQMKRPAGRNPECPVETKQVKLNF